MTQFDINEKEYNNIYIDLKSQNPEQWKKDEAHKKWQKQRDYDQSIFDGKTKITGKYPHVITHHATPVCLSHLDEEDFYDIKFFVMFHGEVDRWIDNNEQEIRSQMKA